MIQPPSPPPLILAPKAPLANASSTSWSASGQLTPTACKWWWQSVKIRPKVGASFWARAFSACSVRRPISWKLARATVPKSLTFWMASLVWPWIPVSAMTSLAPKSTSNSLKPTLRMNLIGWSLRQVLASSPLGFIWAIISARLTKISKVSWLKSRLK